jgi:hypothetical protein
MEEREEALKAHNPMLALITQAQKSAELQLLQQTIESSNGLGNQLFQSQQQQQHMMMMMSSQQLQAAPGSSSSGGGGKLLLGSQSSPALPSLPRKKLIATITEYVSI